MSKFTVKWSETDSVHVRVYHSHAELVKKSCHAYRGAQRDPVIAPHMEPFLAAVLDIPGVSEATCFCYHAVITKGKAWEWEDIEGAIRDLIGSLNFGDRGQTVAEINELRARHT